MQKHNKKSGFGLRAQKREEKTVTDGRSQERGDKKDIVYELGEKKQARVGEEEDKEGDETDGDGIMTRRPCDVWHFGELNIKEFYRSGILKSANKVLPLRMAQQGH